MQAQVKAVCTCVWGGSYSAGRARLLGRGWGEGSRYHPQPDPYPKTVSLTSGCLSPAKKKEAVAGRSMVYLVMRPPSTSATWEAPRGMELGPIDCMCAYRSFPLLDGGPNRVPTDVLPWTLLSRHLVRVRVGVRHRR